MRLLNAFPVTCTGFTAAADGTVAEVAVEYDAANTKKPKGSLQWISCAAAVPCELRQYR